MILTGLIVCLIGGGVLEYFFSPIEKTIKFVTKIIKCFKK